MRKTQIIIFYTIFIGLYTALNYYIYIRGWQALAGISMPAVKLIYFVVFLMLSLSFILARFSKVFSVKFIGIVSHISGFWLGATLYFILFALFFDLVRVVGKGFSLFPNAVIVNYGEIKFIIFLLSLLVVVVILILGNFNARRLKVSEINIEIDKSASGWDNLHIVFVSDIHLGHVIGERSLNRIIATINNLKPDLVLFPGDLVDEEIDPVIQKDLGKLFKKLDPPFGVFASTGNHEYIGGAEKAVAYLRQNDITFLRDQWIQINDSIVIVGREDQNMSTFAGTRRKSLRNILEDANTDLPIIVMDHQPISLAEATENNVDLQISGHTHNGQMWPLNYLTSRIFKLSWGYKQIDNTHFYVSCGAGTWGPRVRIGSFGEVVSVRIRFIG